MPRSAGESKALTARSGPVRPFMRGRSSFEVAVPCSSLTQVAERWRIESLVLATGSARWWCPMAPCRCSRPRRLPLLLPSGQLWPFPSIQTNCALTGQPIQTLENIPAIALGAPIADVSPSGAVVFAPSTALRRLVWVSRGGGEEPVVESRAATPVPCRPTAIVSSCRRARMWVLDLPEEHVETAGHAKHRGQRLSDVAARRQEPDPSQRRRPSGPDDRRRRGEPALGTTEFDFPGATTPDGKTLRLPAKHGGHELRPVHDADRRSDARSAARTDARLRRRRELSPDGDG